MKSKAGGPVGRATLTGLYRAMLKIRLVEERIAAIYPSDKIQSPIHLCIGQEAVSAGVSLAMGAGDHVYGTYRGHGLYVARGGDLGALFAELFARDGGCCRGRGGSMHVVAPEKGLMGCSAIVASTIPVAVGAALAARLQGRSNPVVAFFGDGAVGEGVLYESLNFAALKKLPVLFVVENNNYAVYSRLKARSGTSELYRLGDALGVRGSRHDGTDAAAVHAATAAALAGISAGGPPRLLEFTTYRWHEHVGPARDLDASYRLPGERAEAAAHDPLAVARRKLKSAFAVTDREFGRWEAETTREIDRAVAFAEKSPHPKKSSLSEGLFAKPAAGIPWRERSATTESRELSYAEALNEAHHQAMRRDPKVFVMGIGADDHKAIFGSTKGLVEAFGRERVFDTPIAEAGMTGVAIGAAVEGMRPVHVHIRADFLYLAMDQLLNLAAKWRYMFGGRMSVPLVVRAVIGRSWGQGAQHSQSLQSFFMHVPGLKVVMPTTPFEAKGYLLSAIFDSNPVIMIEHRLLYDRKGPVPEAAYRIPFGRAFVRRAGKDLTIVASSYMVVEALAAADFLSHHGINVEIVDPVCLAPLDEKTILASVRKTGRLLVVDTSWVSCGASAEIAALAADKAFAALKGPVRRMGCAPTPCPVAKPLESAFYPDAAKIAVAVFEMLGRRVPKSAATAVPTTFKGPF